MSLDSNDGAPRPQGGILRAVYRALGGTAAVGSGALVAWHRLVGSDERAADMRERLALPGGRIDRLPSGATWFHAASVGEVRTVLPLVRRLAAAPAFVTTSTVTGRRSAGDELGNPASLAPLDAPAVVRRFLERTAPKLHVVVETEIWPERLSALSRAGVPSVLVSARLSPKSWRRYERLASIYRPALEHYRFIAPRDEGDEERLLRLGVSRDRIGPVGNLKWDAAAEPASAEEVDRLAARLHVDGSKRWVVVGSAHPGESGPLTGLLDRVPEAGLLVAPRHPRRFDEIATEIAAAGHGLRRASAPASDAGSRVVLLDELGSLRAAYGLASVAVLGGTFAPIGGHNPLEAAAAGKPLVTGPSTSGQADLITPLREAGALFVTEGSDDAVERLVSLLADEGERSRAAASALDCFRARRGHAETLARLIAPLTS